MAPTADRVTVTVHTGAQDDVLRITGASGIPYIMTCLPLDQNAPAIFSFWARADTQISVRISVLGLTDEITVDENWTRYVFLIEQPTGVTLRLIPQSDTALYLYQGMVESGATKPSDWTPAPEDVDADITAAQTDADAAQVAASAAQVTADAAREDFRRVVRIDTEGLHVGDSQTSNEVMIDSESVNVVLGGRKYSKFAGDYVQFGDYQLRRSVDGGLVFKKA